jgi:hypothetical protein
VATCDGFRSRIASVLGSRTVVVKAAARDRPVLAESRRVHNTEPAVPVVRQAAPLQNQHGQNRRTGSTRRKRHGTALLRCAPD